ncbi:MAG: hypothetical protein Q9208_003390 [Pyrenodesmia sp. 3 TL-2023]
MPLRSLSARESREIQEACNRHNYRGGADRSSESLFGVVDTEDRGKTCVALDNIPRGTRFHVEKPLFSIDDVGATRWSSENKIQLEQAASLPRNRGFHDLINPFPLRQSAGKANKARFEANNFQMTEPDDRGKSRQGIFLEAARFNHSCLPNAWFNWNPHLGRNPPGRLTIHATKDITIGEEILVNYQSKNAFRARDQRRRSLHDAYHFWCECRACEIDTTSEPSRAEMRKADKVIRESSGNTSKERWDRGYNLEQLVRLLKAEGIMYPQRATVFGNLADWYWSEWGLPNAINFNSDKSHHDQWLAAARDRLATEVLCLGEDTEEVRDSLQLLARPRKQ